MKKMNVVTAPRAPYSAVASSSFGHEERVDHLVEHCEPDRDEERAWHAVLSTERRDGEGEARPRARALRSVRW